MIQSFSGQYSISALCKTYDVSRNGYYNWAQGGKRSEEKTKEDLVLKEEIKKIHRKSRKSYGRPRMVMALNNLGYECGKHRVRRLMGEEGFIGVQKKKFKPYTTDSNHGFKVAPNLLGDYGPVTKPNEVWVADITYIKITEGWVYLAAILDLSNRKIVGWSMSTKIDASLAVTALRRALKARGVPDMHHSDRGSQYAGDAYQKELKAYGITASMSRTGNPYDNATMESFFGTLKIEEVQGKTYRDAQQARDAIFSYIEAFYNTTRIHTSLAGLSPCQFENNQHDQQLKKEA
ncbi:MAG: IS3 family transposase [Thermodesulfobacteriota bacterium]|nr:IS3 family transposase [Thermodesulfobacteriota bacterium]